MAPADLSPSSSPATALPAEAAAILTRKFEAIGRLAAGITHEINTPMQYLDNNVAFLKTAFRDLLDLQARYREVVDLVRAGRPPDPAHLAALGEAESRLDPGWLATEAVAALDQTLQGIDQISSIVLALKDFSHPAPQEAVFTDLNRILAGVGVITRHEWKYDADLRFDLTDPLPLVQCVRDEIAQVAINLVVNAAHAVKERVRAGALAHGTITVATRTAGDAVIIQVSDDGAGIPDELQKRVFTPFFTTKPAGVGTGQGLPLSLDIVQRRHGGRLEFSSLPGQGTTFTVTLPIAGHAGAPVPTGGKP